MNNINGLSNEQVLDERLKNGSNRISNNKRNSFIKLLLESLGDPIIRILLIALAIKTIFLFKNFDWYETIGIFISVLLASLISSISEYGSEAAFDKLQEEASKIKCKVIRNGKLEEVLIDDVVTNDVLVLEAGDKVAADGKIIEGELSLDESMLNGEKKEIYKYIGDEVYRGSVVYSNRALVIVIKVGKDTMYGNVMSEINEDNPISPLKERLTGFAKSISKLGYVGAILVSLSYLFKVLVINNNFDMSLVVDNLKNINLMADYLIYALTLSVTIIVVAVPEGLPVMITLVLSSNMKRMLKDNVLVRKLVGIETAGSLNVLLTDKTGTLTKGKLDVVSIYSGDLFLFDDVNKLYYYKKFYENVLSSAYYNNDSSISDGVVVGGNSTDKSIMNYFIDSNILNMAVNDKVSFDSKSKYSRCTINGDIYYKGAYEVLFDKCLYYLDRFGERKYIFDRDIINKKIKEITSKGIRVIVLCKSNLKKELMTFIGFICIKDELRDEAIDGISLINSAGINTIMITGDSLDTAKNIASEVGIIQSNNDIALTSDKFNKYSDDDIYKNLDRIKVIARALPKDKSRLVNICVNNDLIVGMTGDGVNDAPALRKANVGFAMGSGTEVAKEAADIVIMDDNILSISKAIMYGRTIFKSIRKFIIYQVTVNMCALFLSIIGPFIGVDTPITIIQMLWLNLIMDTFAALAFSFEPPLKEYMKDDPKRKDEPILNKYMLGEIIFTGIYCAILCVIFLKAPFIKYFIRNDSKYLMTAYFALFIFMGIFNSFNARSSRLNILANIGKNKVFLGMIIFIFIVQVIIIYNGGSLFRTYGLTLKEFIFVLGCAISVIPFDFIRKSYIRRRWYHLNV